MPACVPAHAEDSFQVSVAQLREAITPRAKALLPGYRNNPTGAARRRETLLELAGLAGECDLADLRRVARRVGLWCGAHVRVSSLRGMWERSIVPQGFSKGYAMTGWRVGYAAGPAQLLEGLCKVHQYTIMCAPTSAQMAARTAPREGHNWVAAMVAAYNQ